ncbi:MAG: glycosyltransferase domain-containing protein [Halobacteriota archaeon]|jgi:hypothetical protein
MCKAAKLEALKNWTIEQFLPLYEDLFEMNDKKDISVITAIAGGKDKLLPQPEYKGVEYIAFVDEKVKHPPWKTRDVCDKFAKPVMNAKIHKVLSHTYVDTPYIVWVDGNITLKQDPHKLVKLMGDKDFAFFTHPRRDCIYEEADACIHLQKGDSGEITEQITEYKKNTHPEHGGLCELTAFIRKNTPEANEAFEKWWIEITRYSERDQLSFPVVFKEKKWATIPGTVEEIKCDPIFRGNEFFRLIAHKKLTERDHGRI